MGYSESGSCHAELWRVCMRHQPTPLEPIGRRLFMKGMGAAAATLALPSALKDRRAEATPLTNGGLRLARFAHVTDLHFTNRPQNRYPTSHVHLKRAVCDLNAQDLDFVLFTGDIFHYPHDVEEELPIVRDALNGLRHPYYMAIGNHDTEGDGLARRKRLLADGLGDQGLANGDPYYSVSPLPGLRLIVLDTTDVEGDSYHAWTGSFSEKQAKWLKSTLAKHRDETVFIAMHHPPVTPYPSSNLKPKTKRALRKSSAPTPTFNCSWRATITSAA
jgi:predicted MPP superfamily phosphohydrolase